MGCCAGVKKKIAGLLNKPERIMTLELGKINTSIKGAGIGQSVYSLACGLSIRGSAVGGDKRFFFSPRRADWLRDPPSLLHDRCQGFFPGRKVAEFETDRSPTSVSEVKNETICTSAALYTCKVLESGST